MPSTTGTPTQIPSEVAVPFGDAVTVSPAGPTEPAVVPTTPRPGTVSIVRWGAVDQLPVLRRLQRVGIGALVANGAVLAAPDGVRAATIAASVAALWAASRSSRND